MATADNRAALLTAVARLGHCLPAFAFLSLALSIPSWLSIATLYPITSPACFVCAILMFLSLTHTYLPDPGCQQCDRARGHDPRGAAERATWTLWFVHKMDERSSLTWGCLIFGVLATNAAVRHTGVTLLYIPIDITFVTMCWSTWRHFLLTPWCAYCREDGDGWDDGEHERIPDPEPVGQGIR